MRYWLMKSEPEEFSIEDLRRIQVAGWDGVRNYQARNFLRAMKKGDQALFYHSNANPPGIAGTMLIVRQAYPDRDSSPRAPRWSQVDVKFLKVFKKMLSLDEIRRVPALKNMVLLKHGRLSVQPVTPAEWKTLLKLLNRHEG